MTRTILSLILAVVPLVGCGEQDDGNTGVVKPNLPSSNAIPEKLIADPIVEQAIGRFFSTAKDISPDWMKTPTGELTKTDLEKVFILELTQTEITDVSLKEVVKCKNIKLLNLDETEITDAGLTEVAKLKKLTRLFLSFTRITDAGLKDIAKLQQLTDLYLAGTKITDEEAAELRKALPKCKIIHTHKKD